MTSYVGKHAYILVGKESSYGTPVTCAKDLGLIQSFTPSDDNSYRREHTIAKRNAQNLIAGNFVSTATLEFLLQHGRIFEFVFGGTTTHDDTNTPDIKHVFAEGDTLPSMTLEDGVNSTSDVTMTYAGVKVNNLTLSLALGDSIRVRADLMAKTVATGTSASSAVISSLATHPYYFATLKTGADGNETTQANVQSFELTIRNNLEPQYGLGSRLLTNLIANERHYEFSFTLGFQSKTEYELFLGGSSPDTDGSPTIPSLIFNANNGVTAGNGRREINIDFSDAVYTTTRKPVVIHGYILQDFTGWAKSITSNNTWVYDNISESNWF